MQYSYRPLVLVKKLQPFFSNRKLILMMFKRKKENIKYNTCYVKVMKHPLKQNANTISCEVNTMFKRGTVIIFHTQKHICLNFVKHYLY